MFAIAQFNHKLANGMLNGFLAFRYVDNAVLLTSTELAWYENVCSFGEPFLPLRKAGTEANDRKPLCLFFHSSFASFQDFLVATLNFTTAVSFSSRFVSACLPTKR